MLLSALSQRPVTNSRAYIKDLRLIEARFSDVSADRQLCPPYTTTVTTHLKTAGHSPCSEPKLSAPSICVASCQHATFHKRAQIQRASRRTFWKISSSSTFTRNAASSSFSPFSLLRVTQLMPTMCGRSSSSCLRYQANVCGFPDLNTICVTFSVKRLRTCYQHSGGLLFTHPRPETLEHFREDRACIVPVRRVNVDVRHYAFEAPRSRRTVHNGRERPIASLILHHRFIASNCRLSRTMDRRQSRRAS